MSEPHHDLECPCCDEWIEVFDSTPENFACPWCFEDLHLNVDAEFVDGHWRNLSSLTSKKQEHMKKMLQHCIELECEHKYAEVGTAPTGVKCVKCGHFVGAWE